MQDYIIPLLILGKTLCNRIRKKVVNAKVNSWLIDLSKLTG